MSSNVADKEKIDQLTKLLERRLDHMQSYHDHKETMAHAALLVALAVAGFVLTAADWPPKWVPPIYIPSKWVAFLALAVGWFIIHWYMRWQLRNRRFAAQFDACLLRVLRKWAMNQPSMAEIALATESIPAPSLITRAIDFFFPLEKATVVLEEGLKGYPIAVVEEFAKAATGAIRAERAVSLASLFLFALVTASMLLRP